MVGVGFERRCRGVGGGFQATGVVVAVGAGVGLDQTETICTIEGVGVGGLVARGWTVLGVGVAGTGVGVAGCGHNDEVDDLISVTTAITRITKASRPSSSGVHPPFFRAAGGSRRAEENDADRL